MNEAIRDYLKDLSMAGYAPRTLRNRKGYLLQFISYLEHHEITNLRAVGKRHIHSYLLYLKEEHLTPKGKHLTDGGYHEHLKALRSFFDWLEGHRRILVSPIEKEHAVKKAKPFRLPTVLTEEEVLKILESCSFHTPTGLRDRAILEVLYSTGIRRSELMNLNVTDLSLERKELFISRGKGGGDRVVPIGDYALRFTEAYLKLVRPWMVQSPMENALFLSSSNGSRLKLNQVGEIFQRALERSGITKKVSPHSFRHAMASHLLRNGADLRNIQAILGHARIESTEIYTHLTVEDLKNVIRRCHPHGRR